MFFYDGMQMKERMVCPCLRLVLMSAGTTPILQQPSHVPTYSGLHTAHHLASIPNNETVEEKKARLRKRCLSTAEDTLNTVYLFTSQEANFSNIGENDNNDSQSGLTHILV
jgi:hypothetical protein